MRAIGIVLLTGIAGAAAAVIWFIARPGSAAIVLRPDDPAIVADGRALYAQYCAVCHGANLEGQPDWRVRDADGLLPAPPHDETGHTWHHPDEMLFRITKYGVPDLVGGDYRSAMGVYEDVLTDAEIVAVLSYIKSTWPEDIQARQSALNRRN